MSPIAAPVPPPHRYAVTNTARTNGGSGGGPQQNGYAKASRPLPHIKDLICKAEDRVQDSNYASIARLLDIADQSLRQSLFYLELGRPDTAYVEYVIAYEIFSDVIPEAKDAPHIHDNIHLQEKQRKLRRQLHAEEDRYARVRDVIKADNARNGTQPTLAISSSQTHQANKAQRQQYSPDARPSSLQTVGSYKPPADAELHLQRHSYPVSPSQERPPSHGTSNSSQSSRAPQSHVNGGTANNVSAHVDSTLSDRFAKLRTGASQSSPTDDGLRLSTSGPTSQYAIRRDVPSLHMTHGAPAPLVSRDRVGPSIDTSVGSSLPKQPSPAYTPTRGSQEGARFQPTRSIRNNGQGSYESVQSTAPTASSTRPSSKASTQLTFYEDTDDTSTSSARPVGRRRKSVHKPRETELSAERLYDYLSQFKVLLIDVRPRTAFDAGHIFHREIICIEPTALRQHMSAEDLQEALVLSPDLEQRFFAKRNDFDLIVYYDQSGDMSDFGQHGQRQSNPALSYLNDALLDYNQESPLPWPPIILNGGLDAWADLLGPNALGSSDTMSQPRGKALQRKPVPQDIQQLDIGRRRHREYNPLDKEELDKWRERARSASIMLDQRPQYDATTPHENGDDGIVTMPDYEDFANRFPDVATVEDQRQAHAPRVPQYPIPQPPTTAPTRPAPAPPLHASQQPTMPPPIPAKPPPAVPRRTYSGVGDKFPQTSAPTKPPKLPEYIAPRFRRLPTTGLHNFGVTCYMNATIQCMSATTPLTAFLLQQSNIKSTFETDNWKGTGGVLGELYYILLRNLWDTTDADTIRPTNFRRYCERLNSEWGTDRQQDAKEFLEFLIDSLHEDLNRNWRRTPLRALTEDEEDRREQMPPLVVSNAEWGRSVHRDYSKLTDIFAGQHMSRLQCTVCRHSSTTYEPFYSISVEIPKVSGRNLSIYDCLSSYCSAEMLSGDEVWRCPHCKREREATKRITITRVPQILVIHFKRFSASHAQSAKKITTPIDFPLENLNLEHYVLPQPSPAQAEYIQQRHGTSALETHASMRPPYRYDCYAVMRHLGGTIASGHYIAMVRDEGRQLWRKFDDSNVTNFRPEKLSRSDRLQNEQAYILFYKRTAS